MADKGSRSLREAVANLSRRCEPGHLRALRPYQRRIDLRHVAVWAAARGEEPAAWTGCCRECDPRRRRRSGGDFRRVCRQRPCPRPAGAAGSAETAQPAARCAAGSRGGVTAARLASVARYGPPHALEVTATGVFTVCAPPARLASKAADRSSIQSRSANTERRGPCDFHH